MIPSYHYITIQAKPILLVYSLYPILNAIGVFLHRLNRYLHQEYHPVPQNNHLAAVLKIY
uniref:Uncharacterized protein n=1 Tax=Siphoviridae sp. ctB3v5 TaxID=2826186 RepID=A0A8S5M8Y0_9CAUD|nr:MAG TPA: hypothetical protein [Siphoviridae sp. ctB3v5]